MDSCTFYPGRFNSSYGNRGDGLLVGVGKGTGDGLLVGVAAAAAEGSKATWGVVKTGVWGIKQGSRLQCRRENGKRSLILARKQNLLKWKLLSITLLRSL